MKQKIKTLLATMALLLCCGTMSAHDFYVDGIYYNMTSDATVGVTFRGSSYSSYSDEYSGEIIIPSTVTYSGKEYSVTSIGDNAFYSCLGLTSVTIPNSVTSIGDKVFRWCDGLTSVTIGNSVTSIGSSAFDACSGLKSVNISDIAAWCNIEFGTWTANPLSYAHHLYLNGEEVKDLVIPDGVTSIGNYAFADCDGLTSITIGNSVESIGKEAFSGCSGLTSVAIPNSVKSIEDKAFFGCDGLTSVHISDIAAWCNINFGGNESNVLCYADHLYLNGEEVKDLVIPDGVTSIGNHAFIGWDGLTSVTIPNSVTSIGSSAFAYCFGLTSVTIPNSVTSIGSSAFYACNGLTYITIGNSVESIGEEAFSSCSVLTTVFNFSNLTFTKHSTNHGYVAYYATKVINAPNGIVEGDYLFALIDGKNVLCAYLGNETELTLPENYKNEAYIIGSDAFSYCSSLISVTIPNSVTSIGNYAFQGCIGLTSVTIPNSVTSIGNQAFYSCSELKTVFNFSNLTFTKHSTDHGYVAYYATKVINAPNGIVEDDYLFALIDEKNVLCAYLGNEIELTLPENYKNEAYVIGSDAFSYCSSLISVTIPNSVTSIGNYAFKNCTGLTSVTIPNSVTSIGNSAFYDCKGLTSITIGNSVESIGEYAFAYCSDLTSVTIPYSVTTIGDGAFYYCTELKTIFNFSNLTFTKGDSGHGYVAYYANRVINAPNGSVEGDYIFGVIDGKNVLCAYLGDDTELSLPENYKGEAYTIGSNVFEGYTNLTSVTIPNSVTGIGDGAFYGCSELKTVFNFSNLSLVKGSQDHGCVAYYANRVINAPNGSMEGDYAFSGNNVLCAYIGDETELTLPENYKGEAYAIGSNAFKGYTSLTSVTIPDSVTSIGNSAFFGCSGLTSVTIGNGVTSIGNSAFDDCISLNSITISNSVTSINSYAFSDCTSLTSITIPNSVTSIGHGAFDGCSELKTVINFSNLTLVKGSQDHGCVAYYANRVINAPNGSMEGDYVLCVIDEKNVLCAYLGNETELVLPENYKGHNYEIGSSAFYACTALTSITIPNSVTSIGEYAFYSCKSLTSVTIPNSVTSIGKEAFAYCSGLTSVTIPNSVKSIGEYAFSNCYSLPVEDNIRYADCYLVGVTDLNFSTYTIKEGTRFIGTSAFCDCTNLNSVTIPNSVIRISNDAFKRCTGLGSVNINSLEAWCNIEFGNVEANPVAYAKQLFLDWDLVTALTIPDSITEIHQNAFNSCESLVSVTIPNSVVSIGRGAFYGCTNLNTVINFSELKFAKGSSSDGCIALNANIVINAPNASILDGYVFSVVEGKNTLCRYIGDKTELELPETYNGQGYEIGSSAFEGLSDLVSVVIPDSIYQIGANAFKDCSALLSVSIGNGVTSIGDNAFNGCTTLASVIIPDSVSQIGVNAFNGCSNLSSVSIGNSVATIGDKAFANCEALEKVYLNAEKTPSTSTNVFDGSYIELATLYVPKGMLKKYKVIAPWSGFGQIVEYAPAFTITYMLDGVEFKRDTVEVGATISLPDAPEKEGHTFNGWENVPETMPANDVVVTGSYSVNSYTVKYVLDGVEFKTETVTYGSKVPLPEVSEKEGHTFSGWKDVPETMPAKDIVVEGAYIANKYLLTFKIEDQVISSDSVEFGTRIEVPQAPEKEGHTFNGWEDVPETMPAKNVVVTGSYSVNNYTVTFMLDGIEFKSETVAYGSKVTLPEAPEKEGHTFNGWEDVPESMPAKDIVVTGSYSVNNYTVTFMLDGVEFKTETVTYGNSVPLPEAPEKEGHTFNGWEDVPETMPAKDIVVNGSYTVNIYKIYYYVGDELVHTEEVAYGENIPTYEYTPTNGDKFLGWEGEQYDTMPAHDVTYIANIESGILYINGDMSDYQIYDLNGRKIKNVKTLKSGVYIVNGKKTIVKVN